MKALVCTAPRAVGIRDVPDPELLAGQAILRVTCAGICGVDLSAYLHLRPGASAAHVPGHEVVGVIESLPTGLWPVSVGDRVVVDPFRPCGDCPACREGQANRCERWRLPGVAGEPGAMAERFAAPAADLFGVPPGLPDEAAVLVEPLANAVHLLRKSVEAARGWVAIHGAGLQGCLLLQAILARGGRRVAVVEPDDERRALALAGGASLAIDPRAPDAAEAIREWADGRGADLSIDAAGTPAARSACLASARSGGLAMLLGLRGAPSAIDLSGVVRREIRVHGSFGYTRQDFIGALDLLIGGSAALPGRVRVAPLECGPAEFEAAARFAGGAILRRALAPMRSCP